jgi:ferredoxin
MKLEHLKPVRVAVSIAVLAGTSLAFLDLGTTISPWLSTVLIPFQLVPALTKSLDSFGLWTAGAVAVLTLTLIFGRVYCSTLCPLGTFQDLIIHVAERYRGKRKFRFLHPHYLLQYSLLAGVMVLFLGGSLILLNLVEPFSSFGRIVQVLVRPGLIAVNNGLAVALGIVEVYALYQVPFHAVSLGVFGMTLAFLGMIVYMAAYHGRLFCNTLCPAGALLSLVSRVAAFRIVIDEVTCKDCGLCEKVCKAECIDADNHHVEFGACVSCFNCMKACPTVGLKYGGWFRPGRKPSVHAVNPARRRFVTTGVGSVVGMLAIGADSLKTNPATTERQKHPVTPPGSISIAHFSQQCTACHLCVSACPTRVLVPSVLEYGLAGILQPKMDFWTGFCNYDCTVCGSVCPSGAILRIAPDAKKLVQLGKSQFVKDDCIVITKKTDCGACSEHCPTKAVSMVPHEGKLMLPEVNNEICVGCGACEYACPTKPRKAIYVESNPVHLVAKKPQIKQLETPAEELKEFPF